MCHEHVGHTICGATGRCSVQPVSPASDDRYGDRGAPANGCGRKSTNILRGTSTIYRRRCGLSLSGVTSAYKRRRNLFDDARDNGRDKSENDTPDVFELRRRCRTPAGGIIRTLGATASEREVDDRGEQPASCLP